jgi:hypothetical protein
MTRDSFFEDGPSVSLYQNIRGRDQDREVVEALWCRFQAFCGDPTAAFKSDARQKPWARIWEMRIANEMLEARLTLSRPPRDAADVCVQLSSNQLLWIEAIAVDGGTGRDAAPPARRAGVVNHDAFIRRYTSALEAKRKQALEFKARGSLREQDAFVVAINACAIDLARLESSDIPDIVRSVYPIGPRHFVVPVEINDGRPSADLEHITTAHSHRLAIPRVGRADGIPATGFLDTRYADLSAVVFCAVEPIDATQKNLVVVHNACARVPLSREVVPCGREFWMSLNDAGDFYRLEVADKR